MEIWPEAKSRASGEKTTRPLAVERRIQTKQRTSPRVICFWILLSSFLSNHSQFNPMSGCRPRTRIKKQFSGPDMGLIVWLWLARKRARGGSTAAIYCYLPAAVDKRLEKVRKCGKLVATSWSLEIPFICQRLLAGALTNGISKPISLSLM